MRLRNRVLCCITQIFFKSFLLLFVQNAIKHGSVAIALVQKLAPEIFALIVAKYSVKIAQNAVGFKLYQRFHEFIDGSGV